MSWSKSTSGVAAVVLAAAAAWRSDVEAVDRSIGANEDTVRLHQAQVKRCVDAITAFVADAPEDYVIVTEANGHGWADTVKVGSDQWAVRLAAYKPAAGS